MQNALESLGFTCHRLTFSAPDTPDVENLYARLGSERPNFCFAGHTDVVPPGSRAGWSVDPFAGEIVDGRLIGRGACDMKSGIACFVAAVDRFLAGRRDGFGGSISLLVTGDEEGPAVNGTVKVLEWLGRRGEQLDHCLVGEPTSRRHLGECIKIGRRGSLNGVLTVFGTQGHSAYPQFADNPIPRLMQMLSATAIDPLDEGTEHFEPTLPQITTIDVGNPATNVIPAQARAAFNIRFNDRHDGESLAAWIRARCEEIGEQYELDIEVSGEAFLCPPGPWVDLLVAAVEEATGQPPKLDTGGGTSDARFIKDYCPVAEMGLVGDSLHKMDENAALADLENLAEIYRGVLTRYFAEPPS